MINNNIRRNSDNNNNNSNMISTREKLMLEKKKSRTEEVFIQVKNGNSFSLEEKVTVDFFSPGLGFFFS